MKNIKKIFVCACTGLLLLTGCSKLEKNNVDFSDVNTSDYKVPDSIKKIEVMNIYNDAYVYFELNQKATEDLEAINKSKDSNEVKTKKALLIYNDFIVDMYKLATSRISSDIDTIYTNTDEYMAYIAMLQTFVDAYVDEKDDLQKYISEGNEKILDMFSYKAFINIESYYIEILNAEKEDTDTNDKNESKDDSKQTNTDKKDTNKEQSLDDLINNSQE